ncbi:hypothetical protein HRbin24_00989 [bacterium HR24]|jgi:Fe-S cluster assembly iron-binding protein IscA|nr:hypothetical protein HRbin24_00989 [bacterium HR24]
MALVVTDKAAELLREIKLELAETPDKTLRLVQRGGGFELAFDEARSDDHVYHSGDVPVLLVSPDVAAMLSNATIDAEETEEGPRLTLSTSEEEEDQE